MSTRQITSAMKMVSASKLHKAQSAVIPLRVYTGHLRTIVRDTINQLTSKPHHMLARRDDTQQVLVVVIAANKGLCGNYNDAILKRAHLHIAALNKQGYETKLLLIGKKSDAYFNKLPYSLFAVNYNVLDHISMQAVLMLGKDISEAFNKNSFDRVDVVYNRFVNVVTQELTIEQILPLAGMIDDESSTTDALDKNKPDKRVHDKPTEPLRYIIEPSAETAVEALVPHYFSYNLYRILLDASASEHGARMTAMHKATDNADELLKSLTITYNKVRQAMITREIMEIVGGSEV